MNMELKRDYISSMDDELLRRSLFPYLDMKNLTNLGCTNKYLQRAVHLEFFDRFIHRMIWITNLGSISRIMESRFGLNISGFNLVLNFLKAFGPILKSICYTTSDECMDRRKIVEECISDNCSETLMDLMLCNVPGKLHFKHNFVKVERLIIQWSTVPTYICKINIYFPNLKLLKFESWNYLKNSDLFVGNLNKLNVLMFGKEVNIPFFELIEMYPNLEIIYEKRRF